MNVQPAPLTGSLPAPLRPLFGAGLPDRAAVGAFLAEHGVPLAEPGSLTFAYVGEADRVELLRWIHGGADRAAFARVPGTALWYLVLPVEDGGRFEYKLAVARDGHEEWMLDPLNPARAGDPFGENSVAMTWGYARPGWTLPRGAPEGEVVPLAVASRVFGHERRESAYLPAGYDGARAHPVVVIHDGHDFNAFADLRLSLDNLIAAGDIPPLVALLIQTDDRMGEYPRGRRHARYVVDELLPAAEARFRLSSHGEDRIALGASLGAVASLATALRYPGSFGGLVLKSGSFILDPQKLDARPHPVFRRVAGLVAALRRSSSQPATRAFVSTGEWEGLADENRALASLLHERGVDVLFKSAWDGHHWHNWRDQLRDGLMWVLRQNTNG